MISSLASSSSFTATCSSTQQGGLLRKPMTQIKGLNLRYREPKNLLQRSTVKISAALPDNFGKTDELVSRKNDSLTKCSVSLAAEQAEQGDNAVVQEQVISDPLMTVIAKKWDAFYRFTRPYTIYGTIVGILSISLLPIQSMADFSPAFFYGLVKTIIPTVLVNIYMCGINQIVDIDIDKINKPTLPLASGEFSLAEGTAITALSAMAALLMAATFNSPPLLLGVMSIFFIATAYSVDLPLLRWKAKPYLTCLSIIGIRALTIPLAFFAHVQKYVLGRPLVYTKPVLFTVAFMTIIATIIAVIKDLPDVEGDEAFGLRSPTTIFGRDKIFWGCVYLLMGTYGGAAVLGATSPLLINKIITVVGHGVLAAVLWTRAKSVNIKEPSETLAFYLFIWKLLYAEYFVIPFVR